MRQELKLSIMVGHEELVVILAREDSVECWGAEYRVGGNEQEMRR